MIFFGHLGITFAATRAADKAVVDTPYSMDIDYRLVLLGSILPDIIDKCTLFFLSGEKFRSGRIFSHSLLFILLLFVLGAVVWYAYKKSWALVLAFCSVIHQVLDGMWKHLDIFLWPFFNPQVAEVHKSVNASVNALTPSAPKAPVGGQIEFTWHTAKELLFNPYIGIPEVIGALIILCFLIILVRRKQVGRFLRTGKLR
jgi:inner membrane protein